MLSPSTASYSAGNEGLQYMPLRTAPFGEERSVGRQAQKNAPVSANNTSARLVSEYYSSDSLFLTYSNADGDTVSLAMEHVEYQKAMMNFQGDAGSPEWKDIIDFITKEFDRLHGDMIRRFIDSLNGDTSAQEDKKTDETGDIPGLPEYWNAENTSQRIVDFAVSFYGMFQGEGSDYLDMMRSAIDEGFKQARDMLGNLPGEVDKLVSDTYDLVMKKLDEWAAAQGITVGDEIAVKAA
mgnify:CR=1 FL=1